MQDLKRLASYAAKGCRAELLRTAETLFGVQSDADSFGGLREIKKGVVLTPRLIIISAIIV